MENNVIKDPVSVNIHGKQRWLYAIFRDFVRTIKFNDRKFT